MLRRIEGKYKRVVAVINPDVRRYLSAGRELRLAIYSTTALSVLTITLYLCEYIGFQRSTSAHSGNCDALNRDLR